MLNVPGWRVTGRHLDPRPGKRQGGILGLDEPYGVELDIAVRPSIEGLIEHASSIQISLDGSRWPVAASRQPAVERDIDQFSYHRPGDGLQRNFRLAGAATQEQKERKAQEA